MKRVYTIALWSTAALIGAALALWYIVENWPGSSWTILAASAAYIGITAWRDYSERESRRNDELLKRLNALESAARETTGMVKLIHRRVIGAEFPLK